MPPLPKFLRPLLLVVMAVVIPATALANEKMRRDMLARDHNKCLVGCLANNNGAVCALLCGCTMEAFGELEFADYVRLNIELNSGTVSEENNGLLTNMALVCAAEVDKAFPELAMPPTGELAMPPGEEE